MDPLSPYHEGLTVGSKVRATHLPASRSHALRGERTSGRFASRPWPLLRQDWRIECQLFSETALKEACAWGTERRISLSATFIVGYIKKDSSLGRREGLPGETNRDRHG